MTLSNEHFSVYLGRRPEMPTRWSAYRLGQGVLNFGERFVRQELNHILDLTRFIMEGSPEHVCVVAQ